jgi:hypothetical protein
MHHRTEVGGLVRQRTAGSPEHAVSVLHYRRILARRAHGLPRNAIE